MSDMRAITREEFNRVAAAVEILAAALRRSAYITVTDYEDVLSLTSEREEPRDE